MIKKLTRNCKILFWLNIAWAQQNILLPQIEKFKQETEMYGTSFLTMKNVMCKCSRLSIYKCVDGLFPLKLLIFVNTEAYIYLDNPC